MESVATQFEDRTYQYTQIQREGNICIYEQQHKHNPKVKRYEVVILRGRPAHTWPNGDVTPEHEEYPGASAWGRRGWTCFDVPEARALAATLRQTQETPV
jgi:hypothetical protein